MSGWAKRALQTKIKKTVSVININRLQCIRIDKIIIHNNINNIDERFSKNQKLCKNLIIKCRPIDIVHIQHTLLMKHTKVATD